MADDRNGTISSVPKRSTVVLNSSDLALSPFLPSLVDLLNYIFTYAHVNGVPGKSFLPVENKRFDSGPQQLPNELGPDGFCIIMFEESEGFEKKIIASGSAKPFKPFKEGEVHGSKTNMLFKRDPKAVQPEDGLNGAKKNEARWELLAFGVEKDLKGQGVGGLLTEIAIAEIRRRVAAEWKAKQSTTEGGSADAEPKIVLMLSTMQDLNEPYYLRRGWTTTATKRFEPGTWGSRDGFGIVEMVKPLD